MDALSDAIAALLKRQRDMEARLANVERALGVAPPHAEPAPSPEPPPPAQAAPKPPEPAPPRDGFETRLGLTLLNRAGVVTLVLGVLFFFKYAVDNQWVGETGRVILGVLGGFLALAVGERVAGKGQRTFAQGITGCGIAILYVSFYASFAFYRIAPQPVAFLLMALNTAAAGVLALRYDAQAIAALGLAGGYLTPVLLSTGENLPWVPFSYLLVLDLGALWVGGRRGWRMIQALAAGATFLLYFSWLATGYASTDKLVATLYACVFYVLFASRDFRAVAGAAQFFVALAIAIIHGPGAAPLLPLLIAVLLAGLAIADRRGWPEAPGIAFASFWLAYAGRHVELQAEPRAAFGFLTIAFLAVILWIPWRTLIRSAQARAVDLAVLALNAAAYFAASYDLLDKAHHAWLGLFAAALAAAHFAVARKLWTAAGSGRPVLLYAGVAMCFVTLAIPIQFAGYRITMAWALEGAALAWIASRIADRRLTALALVVLGLALARVFAVEAGLYRDPHAYRAILNPRLPAFATTAAALWLSARWNPRGILALAPYLAGHVTLLVGLSLEALGWAARTASPADLTSVESTSVSILAAAYAVLLVALGVRTRTVVNRILGLALIALVVLKLYLYDVWQIGRMYRVAAFAGLGAFLLLTSFLYSRFRSSIESWWRDGETRG